MAALLDGRCAAARGGGWQVSNVRNLLAIVGRHAQGPLMAQLRPPAWSTGMSAFRRRQNSHQWPICGAKPTFIHSPRTGALRQEVASSLELPR